MICSVSIHCIFLLIINYIFCFLIYLDLFYCILNIASDTLLNVWNHCYLEWLFKTLLFKTLLSSGQLNGTESHTTTTVFCLASFKWAIPFFWSIFPLLGFQYKTPLFSFEEYWVLFQQTTELVEDHWECGGVVSGFVEAGPIHFDLSLETWFLLLNYDPPGSMDNLRSFANTIKLVGIKLQALSSQNPGSC